MPNSPVSKTRPAAAIPPARPLGQTLRPGLMGLLSLVILLLLWQGIAPRYPNVILPPPADVALALARLLGEGQIWPAVGATALHALGGFSLAVVVGGGLGLLAGAQPLLQAALTPICVALLGTPPIAWLVLAMVWFGLGHTNSIFYRCGDRGADGVYRSRGCHGHPQPAMVGSGPGVSTVGGAIGFAASTGPI